MPAVPAASNSLQPWLRPSHGRGTLRATLRGGLAESIEEMATRRRPLKAPAAAPDGRAAIRAVLEATYGDVAKAEALATAKRKKFKKDLNFAIAFAKHMGSEFAKGLQPAFPGVISGEKPSRAVRGMKRVDVKYATPEAGLGLALSFKSVHFGEEEAGDADFIHNLKRNDEELRVEATGHHLRQPYAVMVAVVFLPFESCDDGERTSSFASWVEYLWSLKGRKEPEDPPDRYELVYIGLYARDGSRLGFYEVGGEAPCPRKGSPRKLVSFARLLDRARAVYQERNGLDFFFDGEGPGE